MAALLVDEDAAVDSISRAYYGIFHAATAALEAVGKHPKTHKGTNNRFWVRFVQTGHFPEALGRLLADAQDLREQAEYDAFAVFDLATARGLLDDAEAFVQAAAGLVEELLNES